MQTNTTAAPSPPFLGALLSLPRRGRDFLDARGRGAWIATMVLAFIFFWPLGLALVIYMTATNRWSKHAMFTRTCSSSRQKFGHRWGADRVYASTGNSAFDAYRAETLRRLEEEQAAFEAFLGRLREAKDKQEFDAFMSDRARAAQVVPEEGGAKPGNA